MNSVSSPPRSAVANAFYGLLNPIPFGFFTAALVFDVIYANTGELMWDKSAAWLIAIGLLFAIVPRLINLWQVWGPSRRTVLASGRIDFWLNLLAIAVAIFNSFVHSRDAYSVVPMGLLLSACTVILLGIGNVLVSSRHVTTGSRIYG